MTACVHIANKLISAGLLLLAFSCCDHNKTKSTEVKISFPGDNISNVLVEIQYANVMDAQVKYWLVGSKENPIISPISKQKKNHKFLLSNLKPGQQYVFNTISQGGRDPEVSSNYFFRTIEYTEGIKDEFRVECASPSALPPVFRQGYVMLNRREDPGVVLLLDYRGNIVWYYQAKDAGIKVANFTKNQTFLCLLGTKDYETGYGNAILELSLSGDTLLYLKKGVNNFNQTIHHEVILNSINEVVTLCVEERILDLRSKGGSAKDTVRGDGILVLDRKGRTKWKWTVFDELNPLTDTAILKNKKDWMHANSVSFDDDGNYLVSFYNNGQIWKIDAKTGHVIWKFGKNGDFEMPAYAVFDQAHAVHINDHGLLMLFDNGGNKKRSRTLAFRLNEKEKSAQLAINTWLPPPLFTDRMGSGYLIGDSALLQCASKHSTVVLTNLNGQFLWQLKSSKLISYRAIFISNDKLEPNMLRRSSSL